MVETVWIGFIWWQNSMYSYLCQCGVTDSKHNTNLTPATKLFEILRLKNVARTSTSIHLTLKAVGPLRSGCWRGVDASNIAANFKATLLLRQLKNHTNYDHLRELLSVSPCLLFVFLCLCTFWPADFLTNCCYQVHIIKMKHIFIDACVC